MSDGIRTHDTPYVIERARKHGIRYTAIYTDENGRYKSAGTYDTHERAQTVAEQHEGHVRLRLAETSPADKATITVRDFGVKFLREHAVEPNTKMTYAQLLNAHIYPFIGTRRVAEIGRETIHRLLTVVLPEAGASQSTVVNVRTCLSAMMQMAWDHGYRDGNPVQGIRLKHPPSGPIVVATVPQFQRVYAALPHQPAKVFARLGVSTGARHCELISFIPEDFDFGGCMLTVSKPTVEVTADFHPDGYRFLTRQYTKNGEHRRMKIDAEVAEMVREHITVNSIGPGQLIFPVRLFAARTVAARRERMSEEEMQALGYTDPLSNGKQYQHGTLGGYVTAKCRCSGCMQWSADYGRSRKRQKTGRAEREWSAGLRRDPTEYMGKHTWYRIWNSAVAEAHLPFRFTPYQVRHTHAQRHADAGVAPDVLRDLMNHRNITATLGYYRIGEDRRREAVDRVAALQFDRHGNRIWRDVKMLLDAEHARYAIGEVAVPYGRCAEPSNVAAGGGACPIRFRCAGCDHFRTDVSYLPDLTAYLDDLLRSREHLAAAIDGVDDWARAAATPSQEEITRIRRLINRIKGNLAQLGAPEQTSLDEAITVLRRHRAVSLGMPAIRSGTPGTPATKGQP